MPGPLWALWANPPFFQGDSAGQVPAGESIYEHFRRNGSGLPPPGIAFRDMLEGVLGRQACDINSQRVKLGLHASIWVVL